MLDAPYCLKICLEFLQALGIMRIVPLNSHRPAVFLEKFVNSA
jgi:hypothetical protein